MSLSQVVGEQAALTSAGAEMLATVKLLSEQIGPRESGGENERKAAAYALDRLRKAGYNVELETLPALKTFSWTYAPLYALAAAGGLLSRRSPKVGAALGAAGLLLFLIENHGFRIVSRLPGLPRGRSQNVIGRLRLPEDEIEPELRIVLTAHLDSARSGLPYHPQLVGNFRKTFLVGLLAMGVVVGGNVALALRRRKHTGWPGRVLSAVGAYLLVPFGFIVHREFAMKVVPGASDNASGVAVLLAAAERLARLRRSRDKDRLRPAEIWVVLTGGEESGLEGMQELLRRYGHEFDRETTLFINVDNVGAGELSLISEEGMIWSHSSDAELIDAGVGVALSRGMPIRVRPFHAMSTDALVPLSRRLRAMSIMALDDRGLPPNWHWETDTADRVDPNVMAGAYDLLTRLVRRLVRKPARR